MTTAMRRMVALIAVLVLALSVGACGSDDDGGDEGGGGGAAGVEAIERDPANEGKTFTVGSKNFEEQFILGEIYGQALEAAGFDVEKKLNLGSEQIAYKALKAGQIDGYPEYTGTSLTSFFGVKVEDVPKDPDEAYEQVKAEYAAQDITALPRTKFENTYRIVTSKENQTDLLKGAKTVSEVTDLPNAGELKLAGFPECRQRTDCLLGLRDTYGWEPEFVSDTGKYDPINRDRSDLGFVFSTDGELLTDEYPIIEDDKNLFPPYNISFGISNEALKTIGPKGEETLTAVQEPLTEEVMRELNKRVTIRKQEPEKVAGDYLAQFGFVE